MPAYPDIANPALLERIPLTARTVLDCGCATGALGLAYRRLNPRARLYGIEGDVAAAETARARLDEVAVVDLDANPVPFDPAIRFDCIVYGDVIEHLREPWRVIAAQAETLAPGGTILISVPNVEHWSFAARLLAGTWDYEEMGLFDRTHLRWFSLDTMRRGLRGLGLWPVDYAPRIFGAEQAAAFVQAIAPALAALDIDPADYGRRAAPLQYLWRVRKEPVQPLVIATSMLEHVGGVSHVRILQPMQAVATDPAVSVQSASVGEIPDVPQDVAKIFIFHRPILVGEHGLSVLRGLLARDWVIVTEFDDHPDHFPPLLRNDSHVFRGVHAVQTSTGPLADVLRERNPEVQVFANAIRELPEPSNFTDDGQITLFFGALNREADWPPYLDTLNQVIGEVGDRLAFHVVHDRELFDSLSTPFKTFSPLCEYDVYLRLLGGAEISFMPLANSWFNRAKSDLKFIEAAACRVVALASDVVYADSIRDGETGVLFRSPDELRARLLALVNDRTAGRRIGEAARAWVREHRMLAYQTADRIAWYRELWDRRRELTAALLARTPELGGARGA
jgi:SAM-dependent methyltransferase